LRRIPGRCRTLGLTRGAANGSACKSSSNARTCTTGPGGRNPDAGFAWENEMLQLTFYVEIEVNLFGSGSLKRQKRRKY
jgi:hypothetical protein